MKTPTLSILCLVVAQVAANAASISITIDSGSQSLRDQLGVVLSGGIAGVNGDGTQVRLGYFNDATSAANPFGTSAASAFSSFVALTGPGTPFGINFTIGDSAGNATGAGELFVDPFSINTGVADGLLPAAGTPLVLRVFNAAQTFFVDLSNNTGAWNWVAPNTPPSTLSLNFGDTGLVYRSTGDSLRTTVSAPLNVLTNNAAVPEPSAVILCGVAAIGMLSRRNRRR